MTNVTLAVAGRDPSPWSPPRATQTWDGRACRRVTTTVRAEGRATWSGTEHVVQVGDTEVEVWNRARDTTRRRVTYDLFWYPAGHEPPPPEERPRQRSFPTNAERARRLEALAPGIDLQPVTQEPIVRRHPLEELLGQYLIGVWFVSVHLQLQFQPGGTTAVLSTQGPLTFDVPPLLIVGERTFEDGQPGYADGMVALISEQLTDVDDFLDSGLDLTFSGGQRISMPLGPIPDWADLASYRTRHSVCVWMAGEPPFDQSPPAPL